MARLGPGGETAVTFAIRFCDGIGAADRRCRAGIGLLFAPASAFRTILLKGCALTGERAGTRTQDLLIKSQLLYRLSYALVASP
jgi:hypothetical protein